MTYTMDILIHGRTLHGTRVQVHIWCAWAQTARSEPWPTILIKEHLQNSVSLKSSVCAKVDGWKALLGIGIAYCVARSRPTTLLEPVALRAGERRAWA